MFLIVEIPYLIFDHCHFNLPNLCHLSFNPYIILNNTEGSNISQPLHAQQANGRGPNNVRNNSSEPRKRFLASGSSDEDPYSLTPSGSSGSSGKASNFENIDCLRKHSILITIM